MDATADRDPLLPQHPGGQRTGMAMAIVAHAALAGGLVWGLNWQSETPAVVSAELWATVPQVATPAPETAPAPPQVVREPAPPPPPPPAVREEPPPPDPQIALERERRERAEREQRERLERERLDKLEKERQEREAREKAAKEAARVAAEKAAREREARLAQQREENLRRMMGQIGASGPSPGSAERDAAPSRSYAGKLVAHIKPNIVFTETIAGNPAAEVEVRAAPGGAIVSRRLVKSSGHKDWDEAVLRAIDRTGTLPRDVDGRVPAVLLIAFRPND